MSFPSSLLSTLEGGYPVYSHLGWLRDPYFAYFTPNNYGSMILRALFGGRPAWPVQEAKRKNYHFFSGHVWREVAQPHRHVLYQRGSRSKCYGLFGSQNGGLPLGFPLKLAESGSPQKTTHPYKLGRIPASTGANQDGYWQRLVRLPCAALFLWNYILPAPVQVLLVTHASISP